PPPHRDASDQPQGAERARARPSLFVPPRREHSYREQLQVQLRSLCRAGAGLGLAGQGKLDRQGPDVLGPCADGVRTIVAGPSGAALASSNSREGEAMNIAVICTALLGLLLFGLGFHVSLQRRENRRSMGYEASPVDPLHRAVRAHANTAEYAPF